MDVFDDDLLEPVDATIAQKRQSRIKERRRGYFNVVMYTAWMAFFFVVLLKQGSTSVAYSLQKGVEETFTKVQFTDTTRNIQLTFEDITDFDQWYDWLDQVAFAALYDVDKISDLTTSVTMFTCSNGDTILKSYRCDGKQDCSDGSDEAACQTVDQQKTLLSGSGLNVDFPNQQTEATIMFSCYANQITVSSNNSAVGAVISQQLLNYSRVGIDSAASFATQFKELSNVTVETGQVILLYTKFDQYHALTVTGGCLQVPYAVTFRWKPLKVPCAEDEYDCAFLFSSASDQITKQGNRIGRCVPSCQWCDGTSDCFVNASTNAGEENFPECSDCGPTLSSFINPRVLIAAPPVVGQQVGETSSCEASSFSSWSPNCTGATFSDLKYNLCVGYCPSVQTVYLNESSVSRVVSRCNGDFAVEAKTTKVVSTEVPSSEEVAVKQQDCFTFTGVSQVFSASSAFVMPIVSGCPWNTATILSQMQQNSFITSLTKSVFFGLFLFNPDNSFLLSLELRLDLIDTSEIKPVVNLHSLLINPYELTVSENQTRLAFEILVLLGFVGQLLVITIRWFRFIRRRGWMWWFSDWRNYCDLFFIGSFTAYVISWGVYVNSLLNLSVPCTQTELSDAKSLQQSLQQAVDDWDTTTYGVLACLFSTLVQTFRIFSFQTHLKLLTSTIVTSSSLLFSLLVLGLCLIVTFAVLGNLSFGRSNEQFSELDGMLLSLFGVLMGDVSYSTFSTANSTVAPAFFVAYLTVVYLVILNLVVAVLINAFNTESSKVNTQRNSLIIDLKAASHHLRSYWNKHAPTNNKLANNKDDNDNNNNSKSIQATMMTKSSQRLSMQDANRDDQATTEVEMTIANRASGGNADGDGDGGVGVGSGDVGASTGDLSRDVQMLLQLVKELDNKVKALAAN